MTSTDVPELPNDRLVVANKTEPSVADIVRKNRVRANHEQAQEPKRVHPGPPTPIRGANNPKCKPSKRK